MAKIKIYMKPTCPYCQRAIAFLKAKGQEPETIDIAANPEQRDVMIQEIPEGRKPTVPQIFINGEYIGGCDDLLALDEDTVNQKLGVK
ncbi:MAG: glutaredoxin [Gammaproteobacteria bacterium]|nr:glutaredoxin [Gammaproteobacteria bacterium]